MDNKEERNRKIFEERNAGATYRAIGEKYGLSVEVVRQICLRCERRVRQGRIDEDVSLCRAHNAVLRAGITDITKCSDEELLKVRNIGPEALKVLREAYGPYSGKENKDE